MDLRPVLASMYPGVEAEVRFHPTRRWRFDYAWPHKMIAFEIEGGVYKGGRHTSIKGYESDCIKYSEAAILGWKVIRATTGMCKDGRAFDLLDRALQ